MPRADLCHFPTGPAIHQGETDLICAQGHAIRQRKVEVGRVKIRHAQLGNQPFVAQARQFMQGVKPG